ncbi:MAG: lysozyme [Parvularculaceae bacterium]
MKTSENGIELIKRFEGLELEAYQDIAGIWTIGYGHTGPDVEPGMKISERDAEGLLRSDLRSREDAISSAVKKSLNQNEFDALVSFVYNVGAAAFRGSTALKRLNRGDRIGAADALTWWNKATVGGVLREVLGLTRRRAAERALFLAPTEPTRKSSQESFDDNTRASPVEESPRRENIAESRTVQGATIAGGAGVASSTLGKNSADELDKMETNIETGQGLTENPDSHIGAPPATTDQHTPPATDSATTGDAPTGDITGDAGTVTTGDQAASDQATGDQTVTGVPEHPADTGEMVAVPSARPSKHEVHAVESQVQFALLILIILSALFIIYARVEDWWKYRR